MSFILYHLCYTKRNLCYKKRNVVLPAFYPQYDVRLHAPDGTFYRPDFVIQWRSETWYWEHGFADHLITTYETTGFDSQVVQQLIWEKFGV